MPHVFSIMDLLIIESNQGINKDILGFASPTGCAIAGESLRASETAYIQVHVRILPAFYWASLLLKINSNGWKCHPGFGEPAPYLIRGDLTK